MEFAIAFLAIILGLVFVWIRYQLNYWRRRGIPHDEPDFLIGNLKGWRKEKHFVDVVNPIYHKYKGTGPFVGFYLFLRHVALATDIEFVKNVFIRDFNNFDDRGVFHNEEDDPLTGHLFALDGIKWRSLRQKLSQTFTSGKMKFMFPTVVKIGEEFEKVVGIKVKESNDGVLELTELLGRFTADVIGSCAFGIECNSLRHPDAEFVRMGRRAIIERRHNKFIDGLIDAFPDLARRMRMRQIHPSVHEFYMRIVKDTVDYREKNNIQRNDFMNMLIELKNNKDQNSSSISINEIAAQVFVFFLGGFETSSTTMGFELYELAKNQDIQDKLRAHIYEVLKAHQNEFTYECMQDMKYLEQVTSETLRMYPVLPNLVRKANKRYETDDPKYYVEKGTLIVIPAQAIHFDPDFYPEPEKFDPDRFTSEEIKKRPACTWLPFGDGPRNCIGLRFGKMQTSIGIAYLIKNFKFTLCEESPKKIQYDNTGILLNSKDGIRLRVQKL